MPALLPYWDVEEDIQKSGSLRAALITQRNAELKKNYLGESWVKQKYNAVASGQQFLVTYVLGKGFPGGRKGWTLALHSPRSVTSRVFVKKYLTGTAKKDSINIPWTVWPVWKLPRRFIQPPLGKPPRNSSAGLAEERDSRRSEEDWLHSWQPVNWCCCFTAIVCDNSHIENQQRLNLGPPAVYVCTGWCWQPGCGLWQTHRPRSLLSRTDICWLVGMYTLRSHVEKFFLHEICPLAYWGWALNCTVCAGSRLTHASWLLFFSLLETWRKQSWVTGHAGVRATKANTEEPRGCPSWRAHCCA